MIISKSKGVWLIRIYLGRDKEGKRKWYSEQFRAPSKTLARDKERELESKYKNRIRSCVEFITQLSEQKLLNNLWIYRG
jgi:hypothetical protein